MQKEGVTACAVSCSASSLLLIDAYIVLCNSCNLLSGIHVAYWQLDPPTLRCSTGALALAVANWKSSSFVLARSGRGCVYACALWVGVALLWIRLAWPGGVETESYSCWVNVIVVRCLLSPQTWSVVVAIVKNCFLGWKVNVAIASYYINCCDEVAGGMECCHKERVTAISPLVVLLLRFSRCTIGNKIIIRLPFKVASSLLIM